MSAPLFHAPAVQARLLREGDRLTLQLVRGTKVASLEFLEPTPDHKFLDLMLATWDVSNPKQYPDMTSATDLPECEHLIGRAFEFLGVDVEEVAQ